MKVLLLCGVFGEENTDYIVSNAKRAIEYSANVFQKKLIKGFMLSKMDVTVVSAPFVGSYPNASSIFKFRNRSLHDTECRYVSFNNLWGIRNFSRSKSLKKEIADFIDLPDNEKVIVVYSPHTPFLDAAVYAKAKDHRIKICLVVPDLPQYMNLDARLSIAYRIGKKYDIARFNKLNNKVDSYMLLTEAMKDKLNVKNKPYIVVEGIVDSLDFLMDEPKADGEIPSDYLRYIVYTGKMNVKFGIKDLVDAFMKLPGDELRLVLCGKGDAEEYVCEKSKLDYRIIYIGQVPHEEAKAWMYRADVLVNPRKNEGEYTKYSFPSKIIEYLMTGAPVVSYLLDGMPHVYSDFLCTVDDNKLNDAIAAALTVSERHSFREYAESNLLNDVIAKRIVDITLGI